MKWYIFSNEAKRKSDHTLYLKEALYNVTSIHTS